MPTDRPLRFFLALSLAATLALTAGCRRSADEQPAPEPASPVAHISAPVRDTPEQAAATLRWLAEQQSDPAEIVASIDPSQSSTIGRVLAPMLIYYGHTADLRRAVAHRWGDEGVALVNDAASFYTIDFGNGLLELFEADRFEAVRRFGSLSFVMATLESGQPIGAPLVFRDNQGEWLLMLTDGDDPWPQERIANFVMLLSGPVSSAPLYAREFGRIASRVREGLIGNLDDLAAALDAIPR
ncbi:MAG: hypothetical protein EA379_10430 [Phycisphaerales bacterium]|nr:MAG: hypothetical protein EA379_10430 [Phycisphaerales bacterium]